METKLNYLCYILNGAKNFLVKYCKNVVYINFCGVIKLLLQKQDSILARKKFDTVQPSGEPIETLSICSNNNLFLYQNIPLDAKFYNFFEDLFFKFFAGTKLKNSY